MRNVKTTIKKMVYSRFPGLQKFWILVNLRPKFAGWDMVTHAELPSNDRHCPDMKRFRKTNEEIKKRFEFGSDVGVSEDDLGGLLWRHYIISFSVRCALDSHQGGQFNMVEAGVADGISAFFTLREVSGRGKDYDLTLHLYDSWGAMRKKELLPSEYGSIGNYGKLDVNRTKRNLSDFSENIVYHQGYVPESLEGLPPPPDSVNFLHIDTNSAQATGGALEFFWPRMVKRGIILFDDYGWAAYEDMRDLIDAFFAVKEGHLLKLPTGQAIYFCR